MPLLTEIYDVTLKLDIRGKAKEGFVRPTLSECFMSHKDFTAIPSAQDLFFDKITNGVTITNNNLTSTFDDYTGSRGWWGLAISNISKTSGKWYIEFLVNDNTDPTYAGLGIGLLDPNNYSSSYSYFSEKSLFWFTTSGLYVAYPPDGHYSGGGGVSMVNGDVIALSFDIDNYIFKMYKNNVLQHTYTETDPAAKLTEFTFATTGIGSVLTLIPNKESVYYSIPEGFKYFG